MYVMKEIDLIRLKRELLKILYELRLARKAQPIQKRPKPSH